MYHILLSLTRGIALDKVINAGDMEGARAWKLLLDRWDLKLKSRQAGFVLALLRWSFSGDILARIEAFERECQTYASQTGSSLSEDIKADIVLNNLEDGVSRLGTNSWVVLLV